MRTFDEDIPWHLSHQLLLSNNWHLLHHFLVLVCHQHAISVFHKIHDLHLWHFNLHRDFFLKVHHLPLLNNVVDCALYLMVLGLLHDVRHFDLNFFDLLLGLIDVVWHLHDLLDLDVLSASRLDDLLDVAELNALNHALDLYLNWHFLALVNWHCLFSNHRHLSR